jgi:hypothetical protein
LRARNETPPKPNPTVNILAFADEIRAIRDSGEFILKTDRPKVTKKRIRHGLHQDMRQKGINHNKHKRKGKARKQGKLYFCAF